MIVYKGCSVVVQDLTSISGNRMIYLLYKICLCLLHVLKYMQMLRSLLARFCTRWNERTPKLDHPVRGSGLSCFLTATLGLCLREAEVPSVTPVLSRAHICPSTSSVRAQTPRSWGSAASLIFHSLLHSRSASSFLCDALHVMR